MTLFIDSFMSHSYFQPAAHRASWSVRRLRSALLLMSILMSWSASIAVAQTVATYTGPNNGNWSIAANWDIGVVPINNGANTFNVIVPTGKIINYDIAGASTISGLNLVNTGSIKIAAGQSLSVSGFALVGGIVRADGLGAQFQANSPLAGFVPSSELHASNGGIVRITGTSYVNAANYQRSFISALGSGSRIDLGSVLNIETTGNNGSVFATFDLNN